MQFVIHFFTITKSVIRNTVHTFLVYAIWISHKECYQYVNFSSIFFQKATHTKKRNIIILLGLLYYVKYICSVWILLFICLIKIYLSHLNFLLKVSKVWGGLYFFFFNFHNFLVTRKKGNMVKIQCMWATGNKHVSFLAIQDVGAN